MKYLIFMYTNGIECVNKFRSFINERYKDGDTVIVRLEEAGIKYFEDNRWKTFIELIEENLDKNIFYYASNFVNTEKSLPLGYVNNMFEAGQNLYNEDPMCIKLLKECKPVGDKMNADKKWDLLLGSQNECRDEIADIVTNSDIFDTIFFTYFKSSPDKGHWGHGLSPQVHTAEFIGDKFKSKIRFSDLIDPEIYNNTLYTAYTETIDDKEFGVFTEKTAKPIIAKRPFVAFASPGHLRALKRLGFKTFSSVIDESYDDELDRSKRFKMVVDEMRKINEMDPAQVYKKLNLVLNWNKAHFEKHNWNDEYNEKIKNYDERIELTNFEN